METAKKNAPAGIDQQGASKLNYLSDHDSLPRDAPDNEIRFITLRAKFARCGFVLRQLADGSFIISRWQLCRELPDLAAVERFAKLVGVAR